MATKRRKKPLKKSKRAFTKKRRPKKRSLQKRKAIKKKKSARKKKKPVKKKPLKRKVSDLQLRKIRIKIIGIGGGGGSIISEIAPKLSKIKFVNANTDSQALKKSSQGVAAFQFGQNVTHGLGTGMNVELAEKAASSEIERIKKNFQDQDLSIFVSCLGGGTGSGATHIFTKAAKDAKNYTLGIFTLPFLFEGDKRQDIAKAALEKIKPTVNTLIIFPNEKIFQVISQKTPLKESFSAINKIIAANLEGLVEMLFAPGLINIDFADLKTVLSGRGALSFLNTVVTQGENRAEEAAKKILENPFYEYRISGAEKILFNISGGKDLKITEVEKISRSIANSSRKAKIIFGISENDKYKGKIKITLLAVGVGKEQKISSQIKEEILKAKKITNIIPKKQNKKKRTNIQKPKLLVKKNPEPAVKEEKQEIKTRRNALELKKETEKVEKEYVKNDAEWDIPAFLRKKNQ